MFLVKKRYFLIYILAAFFLFFSSCKSQSIFDKSELQTKYNISSQMQKDWLLDINGCKKLRVQYSDDLVDNKKILGISIEDVLKIFGSPNKREKDSLNRYNVILTYYTATDCGSDNSINFYNAWSGIDFNFKDNVLTSIVFVVGN